MDNMNRINDKHLSKVAGGNEGAHNLSVDVDLPQINRNVTLKVYFDGILNISKSIIPAYIGSYTLIFSAAGGKHSVTVNIDDVLYRRYELDFDTDTIL